MVRCASCDTQRRFRNKQFEPTVNNRTSLAKRRYVIRMQSSSVIYHTKAISKGVKHYAGVSARASR